MSPGFYQGISTSGDRIIRYELQWQGGYWQVFMGLGCISSGLYSWYAYPTGSTDPLNPIGSYTGAFTTSVCNCNASVPGTASVTP